MTVFVILLFRRGGAVNTAEEEDDSLTKFITTVFVEQPVGLLQTLSKDSENFLADPGKARGCSTNTFVNN